MSIKSLFTEKYRPKTMDDIILLPRIRKHFENGITQNYILAGNYGGGKTSIARILIGKYTKDIPYLELNASLYTSIEVLRSEIEDFCRYTPMMETDYKYKFVFLDEFERVSIQFQDAFKAFIEKYSKNVRFILTTNHLNKVSEGIKSRMTILNFDAQTIEEEKFLKMAMFKRINNIILPKENSQITKDDLISIINKKYPDFRSILTEVQTYIQTGGFDSDININQKTKALLYDMLYDKSYNYEKIYHFLMTNFGVDKIDILIKLLGKPFIDWSISNNKDINKLFQLNYIIADYTSKLETTTDPIILGLTIIGKFRDILL
ncbi:MAG: AAA family ATPase [Candidatus Muirbacterium halophilum]|nr:AAA family ATPase [Candidatus Muirbacterium halophilum]